MAPALDAGQGGGRGELEPGDREVLGRIGQVQQVVGHLRLLLRGRLGRPDVHSPVHLHRVDRHELDVAEPPRHLEGEGRLA